MIFIDGIILSQRQHDCRQIAGIRSISYREPGDINRDGEAVEEQEVIRESARWAWIQGSHDTAIRVLSHDGNVALAGNPGRWGKSDNLFGLDLDGTIHSANRILGTQQLPPFTRGHTYDPTNGQAVGLDEIAGQTKWTGARVWSIHLTQNYRTGSPENAKHVINWLDSQSIARVKKSRLGSSTVIWGSLNYCQVEAYIKADEMLAHSKSPEHRELLKQTETYQWALQNGIVRIEVKAAKEYLRYKDLTYLGAWNMGTIHEIFKDRTEVLQRCKIDIDDFDLMLIPGRHRMTASAWLRGEDVSQLFNNRMTFYRHAKKLREYGIDITVKRTESFPIRIRTIDMHALEIPDFYKQAA